MGPFGIAASIEEFTMAFENALPDNFSCRSTGGVLQHDSSGQVDWPRRFVSRPLKNLTVSKGVPKLIEKSPWLPLSILEVHP
jgi:hypothetical protein